jgi:hypothetical protein
MPPRHVRRQHGTAEELVQPHRQRVRRSARQNFLQEGALGMQRTTLFLARTPLGPQAMLALDRDRAQMGDHAHIGEVVGRQRLALSRDQAEDHWAPVGIDAGQRHHQNRAVIPLEGLAPIARELFRCPRIGDVDRLASSQRDERRARRQFPAILELAPQQRGVVTHGDMGETMRHIDRHDRTHAPAAMLAGGPDQIEQDAGEIDTGIDPARHLPERVHLRNRGEHAPRPCPILRSLAAFQTSDFLTTVGRHRCSGR